MAGPTTDLAGGTIGGISAFDILSDQKPSGHIVSQKNEYVTVAHGATQSICDSSGFGVNRGFSGPGYISAISFQFAPGNADVTVVSNSVITIAVDGDGGGISMPLADFMMAHDLPGWNTGGAPPSFQNRYFGITEPNNSGANTGFFSGYCLLPIPFYSSVSITLTNGSTSHSTTLWSVVTICTSVPNTWPGTRKLHVSRIHLAPSGPINVAEQHLNITSAAGGRFLGWYLFEDPYNTGNESDPGASLEGNIRIYVDSCSSVWASSTAYASGSTIIDSAGNLETCTTPGVSSGSTPTWPNVVNGTVTDGSAVWTMTAGDATTVWQASKTYAAKLHSIIDSNGNLQVCTTAGTSGSSAPAWATVSGATTSDNSAVWTCCTAHTSAMYNSSGTEDYFMLGFYASNLGSFLQTGVGEVGATLSNNNTLGLYRFHSQTPWRFNSSISLFRQCGDSSQVTEIGAPEVISVCYYYTG